MSDEIAKLRAFFAIPGIIAGILVISIWRYQVGSAYLASFAQFSLTSAPPTINE